MDSGKTGRLIYMLRKEKGMTQRALGELLNVSDRAISKWERGAGCPDISLLNGLSRILGVSAEGLLEGELPPAEARGGNMNRVKFYVCESCGNALFSTGGGEISCCGRKLAALKAKAVDAEHAVKIEEVEDEYFVTIAHPMTKQHYVSFVACLGYDRVLFVKLYPEQDAQLRVPRLRRAKIFVYCSGDGLFETRLK